MYLSEKPRPTDFYKEEDSASTSRDMIIEVSSNGDLPLPHTNHPQPHQILLGESSSDDPEFKSAATGATAAPKKRAETWLQEETRCLISLRHEIDNLFNATKSNKHLWDQISSKMKEKGFDRSPTMCTDKWRNLLKEFKKAKYQDRAGSGSAKMSYYKEIEEILRERSKNGPSSTATSTKLDFMQFSDKGIDDTSISFGQIEDNTRPPTLNLERGLDHDGHPLSMTPTDSVAGSGVPPWSWRDTPAGETQAYGGRVISVRWGDYTRRIGIDGGADSIKEAITSAFRLRTKRAFWLEDQFQIVRSLDRDMPVGNYTLHLDEGLSIKVCLYDESDHIPVHTEDKVFYNEDDYRFFLARRGWTCLRELDGIRIVDCMDDLRPGAIYRGGS